MRRLSVVLCMFVAACLAATSVLRAQATASAPIVAPVFEFTPLLEPLDGPAGTAIFSTIRDLVIAGDGRMYVIDGSSVRQRVGAQLRHVDASGCSRLSQKAEGRLDVVPSVGVASTTFSRIDRAPAASPAANRAIAAATVGTGVAVCGTKPMRSASRVKRMLAVFGG